MLGVELGVDPGVEAGVELGAYVVGANELGRSNSGSGDGLNQFDHDGVLPSLFCTPPLSWKRPRPCALSLVWARRRPSQPVKLGKIWHRNDPGPNPLEDGALLFVFVLVTWPLIMVVDDEDEAVPGPLADGVDAGA